MTSAAPPPASPTPPPSTARALIAGAPAWLQAAAAIGTLALAAVAAFQIIPGSDPVTPTPTPGAMTEEELAQSVVQVQMLANGEMVSWGSGTVIGDGLILTNAHVAAPTDLEIDELVIAVTDESDDAPEPRFRAEAVAADAVLDLAVLRITGTTGGGPYDGSLRAVAIGDSGEVGFGDELVILGYPGIGGETISVRDGRVAGFNGDPTLGERAWIKTDAVMAGGDSGGMVANLAGELIAVPTLLGASPDGQVVDCRVVTDTNSDGVLNDEDQCVPVGGFLNNLRPINLARNLLAAIEDGTTYVPVGGLVDPVVNPEPEPPDFDVSAVRFTRPIFDDEQPFAQPSEDPIWLPGTTPELCAWWQYEGMANGVTWSAIWSLDGEIQFDVALLDQVWNGGETGAWWACARFAGNVPGGVWDLALSVEQTGMATPFVAVGTGLEPVQVGITNDGPESICELYMTPATVPSWGYDWLFGALELAPNTRVTYVLPPVAFDFRGIDCGGAQVFVDQQIVFDGLELIY